MAVDEILLEWAAESGGCCWRTYAWDAPTLSLGYFQDYEQRQSHPSSIECAAVRRLTGGGAILHDAELTYSVVLPADHPLAGRRELLYCSVHGALIETLAEFGVSAAMHEPSPGGPDAEEPFLCFQRRAPGDVVVEGVKVAGSAQRRRRGAVLQHGSVLLSRSEAAPELPGLGDLAGRDIRPDQLADTWQAVLLRRLNVVWTAEPLSQQELAQATTLADGRYSSHGWTSKPRRGGNRGKETL